MAVNCSPKVTWSVHTIQWHILQAESQYSPDLPIKQARPRRERTDNGFICMHCSQRAESGRSLRCHFVCPSQCLSVFVWRSGAQFCDEKVSKISWFYRRFHHKIESMLTTHLVGSQSRPLQPRHLGAVLQGDNLGGKEVLLIRMSSRVQNHFQEVVWIPF